MPIIDRLTQLLDRNDSLYGVICRDPTLTDIELIAEAGYHMIWIDLEHSPLSQSEAIRLARTVSHLNMASMVRIPELTRTHVQILLDGGVETIILPDVRSADQAREFVRLGKFPPTGERGVSTTAPGVGFTLGDDPAATRREADKSTHLMVMFESDDAFERREEIVGVDGVDLVTIGPNDWATGAGLTAAQAADEHGPKIDSILRSACDAGKLVSMNASSPDQIARYRGLGARMFFVGVDVAMKRQAMSRALESAIRGQ
jgi:4-hydroxy-2-oxoheptanedioate aldolase